MGKDKREVWDYLMDIDYGVCLGPVDRINQCWVKDKRIFCGNYDRRVDVKVDLPGLYGGNEGEGGPKGTVEIYVGDNDQLASDVLAARHGLTPATMPGYRGLCHMFFRGSGSKKTKGFRWLSMNPYLPPMEVSVTDIPWDLSLAYGKIQASVGVDSDGNLISAEEFHAADANYVGVLPYEDYQDSGDVFTEAMPAVRTNLAALGFASDTLSAMLDDGGKWELQMSYSWASAGVVHGQLEARVGWDDGSETVYLVEATGEDTGNSATYLLDDDELTPVWIEVRCLRNTTVFSHDPEVILVLGTEPAFTPTSYPGYTIDGSWDTYPGTESIISVGDGQLATLTMTLQADVRNSSDTADAAYAAALQARALDSEGAVLEYFSEGSSGSGHVDLLLSAALPDGTASVEYRAIITPFVPLFSGIYRVQKGSGLTSSTKLAGWCPTDTTGLELLPDANPASILYEALTDKRWGRGEDPASVNTASFAAAAETLYFEKFGLSMGFFQQGTIEDFCQDVIDHIKAMLYKHPATGLWDITLLRDDYDPATLDLWDESNCVATNRKRRAWGETVNQITVTYTNPEDEEEATVVAHDLANIQIQGGISPESRNYYGIRNPYLAQIVADRDVREAAAPLFTATLEVDRSAWNVTPGSVRKFSWAEDGIVEMVVRVLAVDYGGPEDETISIKVVEDIFAFERTRYSGPQTSEWQGSKIAPAPLSAEMALTLPLGTLIENGLTIEEIDAAPESVQIGFLGDSDEQALLDIEAHTDVVLPTGGTATEAVAKFPPTSSDLLTVALAAEASSTIDADLIEGLFSDAPGAGDLLMLGDAEAGSEIIMLDALADGLWTVIRGVWDTVPLAWPIGSRLWAFATGGSASDPTERASGETVTYRLLPRNRQGRLPYSSAEPVTITTTARPHQPFRPADTQLDGAGFDMLDYQGTTPPATVAATWATRNRTVEDSVVMRWGDAATAGEAGQTVTLRIKDYFGVVSSEITGLTGNSHDIPIASLQAVALGTVEFVAVRDGVESWAAAAREFVISVGWGDAWGLFWGGPGS